ncbi:helix-turn-helix transcriptional regulator [Variovorax sp. J22G73]|uniref:helix-turn-helix domain-containing protein n=1 Tax=Variovorax sp. J22R203 TaxID=3053512 RepID=UPI0025765CF2|nr:helix-turn-helix transcriptional regulator [Variovorax sp. J22R203]MDM0006422.1 helix-turn-helix transcriptional regulator [Variovorax sp. J22R203]MDM0097555.1 helix-turn-helix transcriptional regulator [Variovorax sp. J22G73]
MSNTARIMRKRFGAWLKEAREQVGLTQLDLAALLDYAYPTTISQIERGAAALPPGELHRWAEAIRLTPKKVAETYLYYTEPFLYAALHGKDPYALEKLPRPEPVLMRRSSRTGPKPS